MAGLGGAYLSLSYTPLWVEGMTAGRGWIALALVVFATWRPWRLLLGAYLFGGVTILQLYAQGSGRLRRAGAVPVDAAVPGDHRRAGAHLGGPWKSRLERAGLPRHSRSVPQRERNRQLRETRPMPAPSDRARHAARRKRRRSPRCCWRSAARLRAQEPVKVGFVYVGPIGDAGWTYRTTSAARQWRRRSATRSRPPSSRTSRRARTPSA